MLLLAAFACAPETPVSTDPVAMSVPDDAVLADLSDPGAWEVFDGVDGTGCSLSSAGWSIRQQDAGTGYCWLGLREVVDTGEQRLALTVGWTGSVAAQGRVQAELEGVAGDDYADWAVSPGFSEEALLTELEGPVRVALRLAVTCEPCDGPEGATVERLELWAW